MPGDMIGSHKIVPAGREEHRDQRNRNHVGDVGQNFTQELHASRAYHSTEPSHLPRSFSRGMSTNRATAIDPVQIVW